MVRRRAALPVLLSALALGGCGGDDPPAPGSAQKDPAAMSAGDLDRDARFWADQTPAGREQLATLCRAQQARAAEQAAMAEAEKDPETDDADPLAVVTAGQDAKTAVLEIDARDLATAIDKSVKSSADRTIADACADVVDGATEPTSVQIVGADEESILGANSYVADPALRVKIAGTIEPAGDGMQMELERRLSDEWEYLETDPPEPHGTFTLNLNAYRRNSNLYRIKARGTGASQATTVEIYFDRPR